MDAEQRRLIVQKEDFYFNVIIVVTLMTMVVIPILLVLTKEPVNQKEIFMQDCLKYHKKYECIAIYSSTKH